MNIPKSEDINWNIVLTTRKQNSLRNYKNKLTMFLLNDEAMLFTVIQEDTLPFNITSRQLYFNKKVNHVSQIIGYSLVHNENIIESKSSNFGKILAGGLLFGGFGAIAGALDSGRNIKSLNKSTYSIRLIVDDLERATIDIKCESQEKAYNLLYTLALIEKKYSQLNNDNRKLEDTQTLESIQSISQELKNLNELKKSGVITEEEYKDLKARVIKKMN